jgi:Fe-S cluster assembly protein SufD
MNKDTIYINNPDKLDLNFLENEETSYLILINENTQKKYSYFLNFKNKNSLSRIIFLIIGKNNMETEININVNHEADKTNCDLKFKTVLFNNAKVFFTGNIFVGKNLKDLSSNMIHHNLLVSENAMIRSKPNLEINSNDVMVNHGFASGNFPPEMIYYLSSRGLKEKTIQKLLIKAFIYKELKKLPKTTRIQIKKDIECSMPK